MKTNLETIDRRAFLKMTAMTSAGLALAGIASSAEAPAAKKKLKLGSILISDLDAYESLEEKHLKEVKAKADGLGIQIHAGTWSICPTSKFFKNKWGTAEEHLALAIRAAKALGSPVIRCILGMGDDRKSNGGIEGRIEDTVKVCKACRNCALDA